VKYQKEYLIKRGKEKQGDGVNSYSAALETPDEGIRGARRPHAVELGRVPDGLVSQLRHADRVGSRARGRVDEAVTGNGVVHMRLVVWAVEVLAVPAAKHLLIKYPFSLHARLFPVTGKNGYAPGVITHAGKW
jgi:hypothetical protein